jgi:hypothetical protein
MKMVLHKGSVSREFIIDLYKAIELIEKDNKKTIRFNPF